MAGKKRLDTYGAASLTNYAADAAAKSADEGQENTSTVNPKSLANLHERRDGKSPTKYMQVNVYGYEDYLYRMARYNKKTTAGYVLSLIKKDAEEHAAEYENLKMLSEFDKPYRESPNRKKDKEEN